MANAHAPILEFDPDRDGVFRTLARADGDVPAAAVGCFLLDVIDAATAVDGARLIAQLPSQGGLWDIPYAGSRLAVFFPGMGSGLSAAVTEIVLGFGCRAIVACGGAGALVPELAMGHVVVRNAAIRDEGASYHYLPAGREVATDPNVLSVIVDAVGRHGLPATVAKTWTTDALFRETRGKIDRRIAEGCVVVDMEAAAMLAVAQFRGVPLGCMLYAGDDLSGLEHDHRNWTASEVRQHLFAAAADAALTLAHTD